MFEPEYSDDYTDPRLAIFYDQMNPWCPSDDFYLGLVMSAESVLDVGCGTGRLLRRARADGHTGRLVGLDPAAAMLDQAKVALDQATVVLDQGKVVLDQARVVLDQAKVASDVDWIHGDLGTVSFDHEFDLIIMTGHVFQVFLTDDDIARTLTAVRAALADGGRYAFETLNPLLRPWEQWTGSEEVIGPDGTVVTAANTEPRLIDGEDVNGPDVDGHDVTGQVVEVVGRFSSPTWERDLLCPSRFRFTEVGALDAFLSKAGFSVVKHYGDWDRRPFTEQRPEIITIATAG